MLNLAQLLQREIPPLPAGTVRRHRLEDDDEVPGVLDTKTCRACGLEKQITEFPARRGHGRSGTCKPCALAQDTAAQKLRREAKRAAKQAAGEYIKRPTSECHAEIMSVLTDTPQTITEVGDKLGMPCKRSHYHLIRMAGLGLIGVSRIPNNRGQAVNKYFLLEVKK